MDQLRQNYRRQWHPTTWWLRTAKKVINQGSPLWQGIWTTWCKVRMGISQHEPTTKEKMFHQPLFGNMKISSQEGLPWGLEPKSRFCLWASKGIQHLKDLWNEDGNKWESLRKFKKIT